MLGNDFHDLTFADYLLHYKAIGSGTAGTALTMPLSAS